MQIPFSTLILAGGRSSRMGLDKATLDWKGRPLWRYQMEKMTALGADEVFVSRGADHLKELFPPDIQGGWLVDLIPDQGPLRGVLEGMCRSRNSFLLVLAVDLPLISVSTLKRLIDGISGGTGVVFRNENFYEPLTGIYPVAFRGEIERSIEGGENSIQRLLTDWVDQGRMREMLIPSEIKFEWENVNTPEDWERVRSVIA